MLLFVECRKNYTQNYTHCSQVMTVDMTQLRVQVRVSPQPEPELLSVQHNRRLSIRYLHSRAVSSEVDLPSVALARITANIQVEKGSRNKLVTGALYRIAGYFRGRKISRISRIFAVTRKYYSRKKVGVILQHLSRSLRLYSKPTIAVIHEIIFREMHQDS